MAILSQLHNEHREKFILFTQAFEWMNTVDRHHDDWWHTHNMGTRIFDVGFFESAIPQSIENFNTGWIDYNMALDPRGGPKWLPDNGKTVDAALHIDVDKDEFRKRAMFYFLGHFRFGYCKSVV